MRLRGILLILLVLSLTSSYADTIELKVTVTATSGHIPQSVSLRSYTGGGDVITADVSKGTYLLRVPVTGAALYNLRFLQTSYEMMLSTVDKTPKASITIENDELKNIYIEKSAENEAYEQFASQVRVYDAKLRTLFVKCEKEESCGKELNDLLLDYKNALDGISSRYKGTYTAETLCKMRMPVIAKDVSNSAAEFRAGFFGAVPFSDKNILNNPIYLEMIAAYADYLIEPKISKEEALIKDLMNKAKADPMVLSQTAGYLYEALFSRSREKMLSLFITYYTENKEAINNPVVDQKVKNLTVTMPGGHYLDIVRTDVAGRQTSLKEVVASSKCTLLLFWSSECSHCREEMPQVKAAYEKYHAKGLNIFAVSLEQDKTKWADYIKENGLTWTNVANIKDNDNPAVQYLVMATPTLILIDKNGMIMHRFTPKNKLEKYIEEVLK